MKVYVLEEVDFYDGGHTLGVFKTAEAAKNSTELAEAVASDPRRRETPQVWISECEGADWTTNVEGRSAQWFYIEEYEVKG